MNLSKILKFHLFLQAKKDFTTLKGKSTNASSNGQVAGEPADAKVFIVSVSTGLFQRNIDLKASSWDPSWGG